MSEKKLNIQNVIFDLGAVMFDWNPASISKKFTADTDLQQSIQSQLYYHRDWIDFDNGIIDEKEATRRASERLGISLTEAQRLFKEIKASLKLITKTLDVLHQVKSKNLKAYCLSNISPELFEHLYNQHDLFEMFDGIVTSGVENTGKPGRRIFEILLERYQLNPKECLFIDDSHANTKTARELGITTVTFKGLDTCYKEIYTHI